MKINIGCGEDKLPGYLNIDLEIKCKPDLVLDIRTLELPCSRDTVDEIAMFHSLEHVERRYWDHIFQEVKRCLKPNGQFILAYPEFSKCAANFLVDKDGKKGFWLNTLYGRQLWPGDYHVTAMHSPELTTILESYGFYRVRWMPEEGEDFNSVMVAFKDPEPCNREGIIAKELELGDSISLSDV